MKADDMKRMFIFLLVLAMNMLVPSGQKLDASEQIFHTFVQGVYSGKAPVCWRPNREYTLPRLDPGELGDIQPLYLRKERPHRRITLAVTPPVFEIPGFLNDTECDHIVKQAGREGLMNEDKDDEKASMDPKPTDLKNVRRVSQTSLLTYDDDEIMRTIKERAIKLTNMPRDLVDETEPLQVVKYEVGGYYHAHLDSSGGIENTSKPCCHITHELHSLDKCKQCRYITVLLYLNNVEEGGETAFLAPDIEDYEQMDDLKNLSYSCYKAPVLVKPKKGTALLWYNNEVDELTGWLGITDPRSKHGGCDIVRGEKWLANMWLDVPSVDAKDQSSIYKIKWN